MSKYSVAVLMGSKSDLPTMEACMDVLRELEIPHEVRLLSAHRTPEAVGEFIAKCDASNVGVYIAAAGMAAHLAGVVASHTTKPVIGVPMPGGAYNGQDAMLSTAQMPGGMPVATLAVGKAGAKNAAVLAAQIIGLADSDVATRVAAHRTKQRDDVLAVDKEFSRVWPE